MGTSLRDPCRAARAADISDAARARAFFEAHFLPLRISRLGEDDGFVTGYYEPVIDGSRTQTDVYTVPVYRRPSNLFVRGFTQDAAGLPNKGQVFRKIGRRKLVPYYDRAEIEDGAIAGRGLEICWLKSQTDLLFAQIQGSARVRLEDGSTIRINYDAHNGYPYTAVGRILIDRGIIPKEQMSMQRIREWMEQNPDGAKELRRQNRAYVFFREVPLSDKDEAVGAQGVPLTPGRSIAVDKALHVYGTPFFIEGELPIESAQSRTPFRRLMIAQDTGSAITGPARADLYFGAGADAGKVSGRLRHNMRFVILVPKSLDPVARGRKMPVPDPRPSEKIAKLFPQVDPLKDAAKSKEPAGACEERGGHAGAACSGRGAGFRTSNGTPPAGAAAASPAEHRARPQPPSPPSLSPVSPRPMKRSPTPIPELSASPRRKRSLARKSARCGRALPNRPNRCGKSRAPPRRRPICPSRMHRLRANLRHRRSQLATGQNPARAEARGAAAGAARASRAFAIVTRQERDRCPARPARHDADARPSRAVRLPAARPQ